MQIACPGCKAVLAKVEVVECFHLQAGCGKCGHVFDMKCEPEPVVEGEPPKTAEGEPLVVTV